MDTTRHLTQSPGIPQLALRLVAMAGLIGLLILLSAWPRSWPPGQQLTVWVNIMFFVILGIADQLVLAPVLDTWPLARTTAIVVETLVFGWFFAPGRLRPASKILFFAHIGPFFAAVIGSAAVVALIQWYRQR